MKGVVTVQKVVARCSVPNNKWEGESESESEREREREIMARRKSSLCLKRR